MVPSLHSSGKIVAGEPLDIFDNGLDVFAILFGKTVSLEGLVSSNRSVKVPLYFCASP